MRRWYFTLTAFMLMGCSFYNLQTPDTVPVGRTAVGVGFTGFQHVPLLLPGFFFRTGISENMDIGLHTWFWGAKSDIKYAFNRNFALGMGGGMALAGVMIYELEGTMYLGLPIGETFEPYGVGKVMVLGGEILGEDFQRIYGGSGTLGSISGGLRLKLSLFSLYGEIGAWVPLSSEGSSTGIFSMGMTIGH